MNDDRAAGDLDLSIVIPAYKEASKIERDIDAAAAFIRGACLRAEIIIVDDGSPDRTAAVAAARIGEVPELRVFGYRPNRGKGHAVAYGMQRARGNIVMFADSGLCVPYEIATLGMQMLALDLCDIAHGSRRVRGSVRRAQPLLRRIGSRAFALLIHTLIGVPPSITDTQCGFKLYRRNVAHTLFAEVRCDSGMFDVELVLLAVRHRYRILEFPVLWTSDPDSRYDPLRGGAIETLRDVTAIRLRLLGLLRAPVKPPVVAS